MNTPVETLVTELFNGTAAKHVKPSLPKTLTGGEHPAWFATFMKKRFRRRHRKHLTDSQLAVADELIEHRAFNPPARALNQPT